MYRRAGLFGLALALVGCTEQVVLRDTWDAGSSDLGGARDAFSWPEGDAWCGPAYYGHPNYHPQTAQVVILLDHSTSMQTPFDGTTRAGAAQTAIGNAIESYQSKVQFGFEEFPADSNDKEAFASCPRTTCCAGSVNTLTDYNSINGWLQCGDPQSSPCPPSTADSLSFAALDRAGDYFSKPRSHSSNDYLLLVTSAEPSCAALTDINPCSDAITAASYLGTKQVRIVVFSIGYQPAADSCLLEISKIGTDGPPIPNNKTSLYTPSSVSALNTAVTEVVSAAARKPCTLDTGDPVPPFQTTPFTVKIGGTTIPQITSKGGDGWYFETDNYPRIILSGSACDLFVPSPRDDVSVTYTSCYYQQP